AGMDAVENQRQIMSKTAVEKTWKVPAHHGRGPVSICVRMPDVLIIDSRGRHILIAPEQARLMSTEMGCVADWIHDCMGD
ncbi:MAG: hypothetical protein WCC38_00105, partial [Pseudonocardiaceae bacterium]